MIDGDVNEVALIKRVKQRTVPLLVLTFLIAIIDRSNVGFAKLQMVTALGMTEQQYGLASSMFFVGYALFEIPSALAVRRFGARLWFTRILVSWGIATILLAFATSGSVFSALRFLVGAAEAGVYPGVILYITMWYPQRYRAQIVGLFTLGSAFGNMLGSLIGGPLLDLDGYLGLAGWQWVFVSTGLPALILSLVVFLILPDRPGTAGFLSGGEREWLLDQVDRDAPAAPAGHGSLSWIWSLSLWLLVLDYTLISVALYGMTYWLPTVVRDFGVTSTGNGLLSALPWAAGAIGLLIVSPRLRDVRSVSATFVAVALTGFVCFIVSIFVQASWLRFTLLIVGTPCISILYPCFWYWPPRLFPAAQAAVAIGMITTMAQVGGFFAQNLVPLASRTFGAPVWGMLVPGTCMAILALRGAARFWSPRTA